MKTAAAIAELSARLAAAAADRDELRIHRNKVSRAYTASEERGEPDAELARAWRRYVIAQECLELAVAAVADLRRELDYALSEES